MNIKNIGYFVVLFFFTIVYQIPAFLTILIAYPLKLILGNFIKYDHTKLTNYLVRWGLYLTDITFFNTTHFIDSSVDLSKRYVCMMNHQSYLDSVVGGIIKNKSIIPVTGYVKYIPLIGYNAIFSGSPFVKGSSKKDRKTSVTQLMIDIFKNDREATLTMFPEGKRTFSDNILLDDIRTGGFVVAQEIGADIVPVYHNILDRFNDTTMEYNWKKDIYCVWGEPIKVQGKDIEQLKKEYHDKMMQLRNTCIMLKDKKTQ
jgi:1-acyl-sn-glycerol-3-phosphate acyltransferase